uniref:Adenylyl-sulfate kinase n=2 Tax=Noctiluca scintillans TaxID=2966 RepID=A0A7S1AZR2_NOCSC|mmetsp:Transcript_7197/g.19700  ORF Transcript_7197/g.19700 Transcript_7197/m.19700 type:complete len:247 (+) Transcript_7197:92-832(+)|eukprot:CAMPEP_0194521528 /NCGR_PEP_ID=MMETSP0253-20130528/55856_1 /TAXON_ID=2966 /ORGANISM="Noctiluca scintillans" /LENGTH=246 /DNA_ID=CAMNT_0039365893 /DNA_START=42 /DNA_END=782 /DNA_ORIENTATION=-
MSLRSLCVWALFARGILSEVERPYGKVQDSGKSSNIAFHSGIPRDEKWQSVGHQGITIWMTGLSGSGKKTLSIALEYALVQAQAAPYFTNRLHTDDLRMGLTSDLGFTPEDRQENVRRVAEVARLFAEAGAIVITGTQSPYKANREFARDVHVNATLPFLEVFVDAPIEVCEARDPKGLYAKKRQGDVAAIAGIDFPFETPEAPDVHIKTAEVTVEEGVNMILAKLNSVGIHFKRTFEPLELSCER